MSAIFGLIHPGGATLLHRELARMDAAVAQHGTTTGPFFVDGHIGLGHRARAFTPEDVDERQPLVEGGLTLVADARIDNRDDLAHYLGMSVNAAARLSDAAIIMRAFQRWGEDCLGYLIGVFAFAVWDRNRARLFIARSHLGGRMLFVHRSGPLLAFASTPTALVAISSLHRALDLEKITHNLIGQASEPQRTYLAGVDRLLPGHALTADGDGSRVRKYWAPDWNNTLSLASDDDYVEAFVAIHDQVVAQHMRSTSPVAVMLSGGLDSTAIAAFAAPIAASRGERLAAFTQVPQEAAGLMPAGYYADETTFIDAIALQYPVIEPHTVRTADRDPFGDCRALFDQTGCPPFSVSNRSWYEAAIVGTRKSGARVMLTGEYGNLTVSWAGAGLAADLLRDGRHRALLTELRDAFGRNAGRELVQGVLDALLPIRARRAKKRSNSTFDYSPAHPDLQRSTQDNDTAHAIDQRRSWSRHNRHAVLVAPDMMGTFTGAYRALHDVDVRTPLLDRRLVEFCFALPETQQQRGGVSRRLIRRAMAGRLPDAVLGNRQRGAQASDWQLALATYRSTIERELVWAATDPLASALLDVTRLRSLIAELPSAGSNAATTMLYRHTLPRGVMMARFLRWFAESR